MFNTVLDLICIYSNDSHSFCAKILAWPVTKSYRQKS